VGGRASAPSPQLAVLGPLYRGTKAARQTANVALGAIALMRPAKSLRPSTASCATWNEPRFGRVHRFPERRWRRLRGERAPARRVIHDHAQDAARSAWCRVLGPATPHEGSLPPSAASCVQAPPCGEGTALHLTECEKGLRVSGLISRKTLDDTPDWYGLHAALSSQHLVPGTEGTVTAELAPGATGKLNSELRPECCELRCRRTERRLVGSSPTVVGGCLGCGVHTRPQDAARSTWFLASLEAGRDSLGDATWPREPSTR
jgi:hypothetical protein